jgi:hypothetical protein
LLLAYQGDRFPRICRLQSGRQPPMGLHAVMMLRECGGTASAIGTALRAYSDWQWSVWDGGGTVGKSRNQAPKSIFHCSSFIDHLSSPGDHPTLVARCVLPDAYCPMRIARCVLPDAY